MMKILLLPFWASLLLLFSYAGSAQQYSLSQSAYSFQENKGQIHDQNNQPRTDIDARLGQEGFQVFVGKKGLHYQWTRPTESTLARLKQNKDVTPDPAPYTTTVARIDVELLGANPNARLRKENKRPEYTTYYTVKSAQDGLITYNYDRMVYEDIYPNIDWVIYTQQGKMKYDFVVRPGGKVSDIRIQYKGAAQLNLSETGELKLASSLGNLTESAPYSYQDNGQKVASHYQLHNDVLTFDVGAYSGTLTIDPAVDWATYFGEMGSVLVTGEGLKVDNVGNVYINGIALMTQNLATQGAYLVNSNHYQSGYLAKFSAKGVLKWCTYYGGDAAITLQGKSGDVIIDSAGNITVCGNTTKPTFGIATSGVHQATYGGGGADLFLMQFTPDGQRRWGTFLGGEGIDNSFSIATNGSYIYIGGSTTSKTNITTPGSYKSSAAGRRFTFIAKMNLEGTKMDWSTYFDENATAIMTIGLDPIGNVYILSGTTSQSGLATPGAFQLQHNTLPGVRRNCGTIAKFTAQGQLSWATFWGGDDNQDGYAANGAIAVDKNFQVYISTSTASKKYMATPGSNQDTLYGGDNDICLMRLDSAGKRIWATYIGGEGKEDVNRMVINELGEIWLGGITTSTQNISTTDAIDTTYGGGDGDAFVVKYDSLGRNKWGSYYGGKGLDLFNTIDYYKGNLYFVGYTNSVDSLSVATVGAHQASYPGELVSSSMVGRFCFSYTSALGISGLQEVCAGGEFNYSTIPVEDADAYIWTLPSGWEGVVNSNTVNIKFTDTQSGILQLMVIRCEDTVVMQLPITVVTPETPNIRVDKDVLSTTPLFTIYQWCLNGQPIPNATNGTYKVLENGNYTVIVSNDLGCVATSEGYVINNLSVDQLHNQSLVRLYPNPVQQGVLYVKATEPVDISIYSIEGKWIKTAINAKAVETTDMTNGQYIVYAINKEGQIVQITKLLVLHP